MKKAKRRFILFLIMLVVFIPNYLIISNNIIIEHKETTIEDIIKDYRENPDAYNEKYNINSEEEIDDSFVAKVNEEFKDFYNSFDKFVQVSCSIGLALAETLIVNFLILAFFGAAKKYDEFCLSLDNFEENKDYFRELLKDYLPLELSYNHDYQIDYNAIVAELLSLEKKKIIKYENNNITILKKDHLHKLDKYLLDCINSKNSKLSVDLPELNNNAINYFEDSKLLERSTTMTANKFIWSLLLSILGYIIVLILYLNYNGILEKLPIFNSNPYLSVISIIIYILLIVLVFGLPIFIIIKYVLLYKMMQMPRLVRTKLGEEVNYKLTGLKNFIEEFSNLNERNKEELVLWDDYLIYSVMFGHNKKILDDYKKVVKINYIDVK